MGLDAFKISILSASTSISPVGIFLLIISLSLARTFPVTLITNSLRIVSASSNVSAVSGLITICASPFLSLKSKKITPP